MNSHNLRWDAIIGGLVFAGICILWFVDQYTLLEFELALNLTYVLPVVLIIGGLLGIVATLRKPKKLGESNDE